MLKPTLEGELVRLRPVAARDADGLWEIVTDSESRRVTGLTTVRTRPRSRRGAGPCPAWTAGSTWP